MDEKQELPHGARLRTTRTRSAPVLFLRAAAVAFITLLVLFGRPFPQQTRPIIPWRHCGGERTEHADLVKNDQMVAMVKKVPLEAHIMSKCPDALDCLSSQILPTMANISERISFKLSYIGKATDHDDGVECKHGQTECLGNMIELCAADQYPDPKIYLGFTMCLTRRYKDIPRQDLVADCALEHGIDFNRLNDCLSRDDGGYVIDMLQASFERSIAVNATISCTVRLNDKVRCVRDGGEWKDCDGGSDAEDIIRDVNALYNELNGLEA